MNRVIHVALVALVAYLAIPPVNSLGVGPDAESGLDAPNQLGQALPLAYGTYSGTFQSGGDTDWYRVDDPVAAPRCILGTAEPTVPSLLKLRVNNGAQTATISGLAPASVETTMGLAVATLQRSHLNLGSAFTGTYAFDIRAATMTSGLAGESLTGQDAGSTLGTATAASAGCLGGGLGLTDTVDRYTVTLAAGDTIYYSLATTVSGITLDLLDASDASVAPQIGSGGVAGFYVENAGTYQLAVTRVGAPIEATYMIGLGEGPDPGNPCRPHCLLLG